VSRCTLHRWKKVLLSSGGHIKLLDKKRTVPTRRRTRTYPKGLCERVVVIRTVHPGMGKSKLTSLLHAEGYTVSEFSVGRILSGLKKQGLLSYSTHCLSLRAPALCNEKKPQKHKKKLRRLHGYRVLGVDTIVWHIDGVKRYILTA